MIVPSKFNGYNKDGTRNLFMGGGGGGAPTQTTSTVQNTNIPAYAQGYVENMLGATQEQLFQGTRGPDVTNPETGEVTRGDFNITGFKPYQAYGGTYDAQGNQLSYDPTKGIAGFTPDQLKTQQGIMGLQVPDQFRTAGLGMESVYNDMKTNAYTAPTNLGYTADKATANNATAATAGTSQNAIGQGYTASNATSQGYTASDAAAIKAEAARLGVAPEAIAAQFGGPKDVSSGIVSSGSPLTAYQMNAAQSQYAPALQQYGMSAAPTVATKSFTDQGTAQSYMNPYTQNVLDVQNSELNRQAGIASNVRGAQAARAGAFGGSRQAIENAEANRNLAMMKNMNQAQGMQQAYQQAQQQFNAEQGYGLQGQIANQQAGLAVGQQNLGAQLGIQQLGAQTGTQIALANLSNAQQAAVQNQASQLQAQGMTASNALQAALANQSSGLQAGLANQSMAFNTSAQNAQLAQQAALANQSMKGQYGLTQGQFDQAANMQTSAQAQQAALTNAASKNAASQFGASAANTAALQNAAAANQAAQFGAGAGNQASLANQAASNQMAQYNAGLGQQTALSNQAAANQTALSNQAAANQAAQFGAAQGLTSAQTEAQYGLAGNALQLQAANQYAGLGGQQLAAQQGILGMQSTVGAQQQALDQAAKNQAIQDYANAQQYPLMQLGTMSNMLRGLPMQASTTNQYAASPNPLSQAIGTVGAGASIYNAMAPKGAAGGVPSEFKYAKGGITSIPRYDMGGEVESQLENMDEKGLEAQARESSSPSIRKIAQRLLRERQMGKQSQGTGPMGVQYQAAQPQMPSLRSGGIIAFKTGGGANEEGGEDEAMIGMQERLAQPAPTTGGIMGATTQPTTPVPFAPTAGRAMQQAPNIPDFMKAEYADTEKRMNAPLSSFMAERKAAMQEAGVADVAEGQQQQRASLMAERANMGEEKERQRNMRLAEFFANWGSTPGPVLVAGLNAMQKTIPNIVSDEKEQKKARKEIDKSIADLDNATRLEKRGEVDAAMALKLKAAEDMKALNGKFIDYQSRRESDISSAAASKYTADMHFRSEQLRAEASRLDRAARRETDDDNKRFNSYSVAAQNEQRLIGKITDQANGAQYKKDIDDIKTAKMAATDEKGNFDPAKIPAPLRPNFDAAQERINAQQEIWNKQKEQAARDTELAYKRVRINPEAVKDYAKPSAVSSAAPAASSEGPVTGDFSAPTAAHIAALRSNPTQKAAFDAKFGPGAANEYLGK